MDMEVLTYVTSRPCHERPQTEGLSPDAWS
ncbi:MAG: hypothetical protein JWR66_1608 [Modestobacter sp.]|nr:hypothetical protein [Modestobacter sp.]